MVTCLMQSLPLAHSCGEILSQKRLETSFSNAFWVNYCPKCNLYMYRWGLEDKIGISSKNEQEVIHYIENAQKIIKQKHLENISKGL